MTYNSSYVIGIDIGGTNIRVGLVDDNLNVDSFCKHSQHPILNGDSLTRLSDFILEYIEKYGKNKNIRALVVGIPGTIDKDRNIVLSAPNVNGFNGKNVTAHFKKLLSFPVFLERDVSLLFYYDLYYHKIPHEGVLIGFYVGTGLGNVISVDGKLLVGNDGVACELGHIPVLCKNDPCSCGNTGCVECYVAGKYLEELQKTVFPDVEINRLFEKRLKHDEINSYIDRLSIPIATEITILNPRTIFIGGGVLAMKAFPTGLLEQCIRKYTRKPLPADNLHILYSNDSGVNGIIGGAILARDKLKEASL